MQTKNPERQQGRRREDTELQLACALTERIALSGNDDQFRRKLGKPVRDVLAAKIARARTEADLRVELTREVSDAPLFEFRARFEGHPRFSCGDMLTPYDAAIKERMKDLDRKGVVPDDLEQVVARAAVVSAGTRNEDTARKMVQALRCGAVPPAEDIRARQKELLADLAEPRESIIDADKVRLAQQVYRCFTLDEARQICDGRGPLLKTLKSEAARSGVAASFRALHDVSIDGPAPRSILHSMVLSTLGERNTSGQRRVGRSDPAEASRFPTHERWGARALSPEGRPCRQGI